MVNLSSHSEGDNYIMELDLRSLTIDVGEVNLGPWARIRVQLWNDSLKGRW